MKAQLDRVSFVVDDVALLDDISVAVESGSSVMVMGPSGSGKSLLMKVMAGILPASRGSVRIDDNDIAHLSVRALNRLRGNYGFLFQDSALWQNMTVRQNLYLPMQTHHPEWSPEKMEKRVTQLCTYLKYTEDLSQRPVRLSQGERKMASLIRSIVLDPDLVFYDEPRAGLDASSHDRVIKLLRDQKSAGKTQIISSHDSEIASMIADFLLVIDDGKVLAFDTVNNLTRTDDPRLKEILSAVLDLSSSYDSDILEILGSGDIDPFG